MEIFPQDLIRTIRDLAPWLAAGFLAGSFFTFFLLRKIRRWFGSHYRKRGKRAEKKALKLLKRHGFRLVEREPLFHNELWVDGTLTSFEVTPDFLVEKDGRMFVVEVKSGARSASIYNAGARRQVLEYLMAAGYPCLLVIPSDEEITQIELPDSDE